MRILWRSWAAFCATYELARLRSMRNEWVNGHTEQLMHGDIWLTGNGHEFCEDATIKATVYAEPYIYLKSGYDAFSRDNKWDVRFVYNPDLLRYNNTKLLPLAGYWRSDIRDFGISKSSMFGMVLAKKPGNLDKSDIGHIRSEFVSELRGRDFVYWGHGWNADDPNYKGETYADHSYCDDKHFDAQELLAGCRFALALDNSVVNGYLTEKFWNALVAGCVPVYYGHESIKTVIPPDLFVYGFDFDSPRSAILHCESMSDNEWDYKVRNGRAFLESDYFHSWDGWFTAIDEAFHA